MSWADSLIKLSTYEVENRQLRLTEIARKRADAETRLRVLTAEGEADEGLDPGHISAHPV